MLAMLRQRGVLVHGAVPLLLRAVRGLLRSLGWTSHAALRVGRASSLRVGGASSPPANKATSKMSSRPLDLDSARHMRRLLEEVASHKKSLVRHGAYVLAEVVALFRARPLPAAARNEVIQGVHALIGMCTEVEVQSLHAASDGTNKRILKDLLEGYRKSAMRRR